MAQHFAKLQKLGKFQTIMSASRIEEAMTRINTAMARIEAVRAQETATKSEAKSENGDSSGSARVLALVNAHEKLREEVADTIGELDSLIEELEG